MFGPHIGTLHIKQRKQTEKGPADVLLWTVSGHQGNRWREGRVLVPRTNKPYQVTDPPYLCFLCVCCHSRGSLIFFAKVVIESLVERKSWGDIAVDDIKVLDGITLLDCKGEALCIVSVTSFSF